VYTAWEAGKRRTVNHTRARARSPRRAVAVARRGRCDATRRDATRWDENVLQWRALKQSVNVDTNDQTLKALYDVQVRWTWGTLTAIRDVQVRWIWGTLRHINCRSSKPFVTSRFVEPEASRAYISQHPLLPSSLISSILKVLLFRRPLPSPSAAFCLPHR
jgi:hypothetical protein